MLTLSLVSSPPPFLTALRRSPKSPLPSSSSTARRTKSSTSPMAWRSLNAAPRPWSRCGWMGPGTMTLNCTASTSSAFGNSSPRSWPANATSCGAGSGAGWGFLRARPFSQRPPVPSAGGAVSLYSLSLGRWLEQHLSCGTRAQLSSLPASAPALLAPPAGLARDGSLLLPPSPDRREPTLLMANPRLRTRPCPLS